MWSQDCTRPEITRTSEINVDPDANISVLAVAATETNSATFQINNAKLSVPVVNLFINDNINFLENVMQGFKRTVVKLVEMSENNDYTTRSFLDYSYHLV